MKYSIFGKKNKEESNEIIWFECRKPTYMKVECPWLKKKRYFGDKKKSETLEERESYLATKSEVKRLFRAKHLALQKPDFDH